MDSGNDIPIISGWTKTSFIDYPGCPAVLLFLPGCNLRCPYCHNPGIVNGEYDEVPFSDIKDHIIKRKDVIEGAVISGGEPALHSGLKDLCGEIKSLGLKVKIDTNGLEPDVLADCRPDYLALDIKTSLDKYRLLNIPDQYGIDCRERLSKSINIVRSMGDNAEIRITAAPGIVDCEDIESLRPYLQGVNKVFIQPFNPGQPMLDPGYSSVTPYEADELESMRDIFLEAGIECGVRG
jgi:pyruvate formate lyase activating enzyme